ncbi:MAG: hypothetical protein J5781_02035 [Clostridia bacterium]|nr:hypothetical protein [Clostridia bacterium]
MLKKIIDGILKYKGVIIFALAILFAVSVVGTVFFVVKGDKINSDVASYLDEKSETKTGLVFMEEKFGIRGYATVVVRVDENNKQEIATAEENATSEQREEQSQIDIGVFTTGNGNFVFA